MKKIGLGLIYLFLAAFPAAVKLETLAAGWACGAGLLLGIGLYLAGVLRSPKVPEVPDENRRAGAARMGGLLSPSLPRGAGSSRVPVWIPVVSAIVSTAGMYAYIEGPNGVSLRTVSTFLMVPGGILFYVAAKAYFDGPVARRNILRGFVAFFGVCGLTLGATGINIGFGNFTRGAEWLPWAAGGFFLVIGGLLAVWYGLRFQQGEEGVEIGRRLGLAEADSGLLSRDGIYDSRGMFNGVEVKINITQQQEIHGRKFATPAGFKLEVLCACDNPRGARLEIRQEGLFSFNMTGLPKLPPLEYWDGYEVMSDSPDLVVGPLQEIKASAGSLSAGGGFTGLSLEAAGLKAVFQSEGYVSDEYTRRVLGDVTRIAKIFA